MGELFTPTHLVILFLFLLPMSAVVIAPYWQIFKKAGFPGALGLLMIVPLANLIVLYVVAFSRWKTLPEPSVYPAYPPQQPPTV